MKYTKNLLISDLIIRFANTKDLKFLNEIKNRLNFCGFSDLEINEFIDFELSLYKFKGENYNKDILKELYIIGNQNKEKVFDNVDLYKLKSNTSSKKVLFTSELVSIIDEACALCYSSKINEYIAKNEIDNLSKEDKSNWLYNEFLSRFEYFCRCANKLNIKSKKCFFKEKILNLYCNESKICIDSRWDKEFVSSTKFEPYSNEFYYKKGGMMEDV